MADIQASGYSPTVTKRLLSIKLVALRKSVGMSTAEAQRALGWSSTKLFHAEKAKWVRPSGDDVNDMCELYGVHGKDRDALIDLARKSRQRGWWRRFDDVFPDELPGFEAGASMIRTFETAFIPGLLQTPGYIEMITRAAGIDDPAVIKRHVDARLVRQEILTRDQDPCRLHAIIDETAVLRINDPQIRAEQIRHIIQMTERANIEIQILRLTDGVYQGGAEPFVYLSFPDPSDRDIVYLETCIDDRMLEEQDELDRYMRRFNQLSTQAHNPHDTPTYLSQHTE